jgi:hypothetical protein
MDKMQNFTHILAGILICDLIFDVTPIWPLWVQIVVIAVLAFLSHFLIDDIAMITYHPPNSMSKDRFWVIYTWFVWIFFGVLFIIFFIPYWWVMICSLFPDIIDWYTARPLFKKGPFFHPIIDQIRNELFSWIPAWNYKRWAVLIEFAFDIGMGVGIWML